MNIIHIIFTAAVSSMLLIASASTALAIPNPAHVFCIEMGYEVENDNCVFPDKTTCRIQDFYAQTCGQQHIKELSCVKEGEDLRPGRSCCDDLKSISRAVFIPAMQGDNINTPEKCMHSVGSFGVCSPCGNGICDTKLENYCNCPEDCPAEQMTSSTGFRPWYPFFSDSCPAIGTPGLRPDAKHANGAPPSTAFRP